jgi:hypothetical protein
LIRASARQLLHNFRWQTLCRKLCGNLNKLGDQKFLPPCRRLYTSPSSSSTNEKPVAKIELFATDFYQATRVRQ